MTLTLTPDTATARVGIRIDSSQSITRVVRTDTNGTADVRTTASLLPTTAPATGTTATVLDDYEAAHGEVTYRVYSGATVIETGTTTLVLDGPWIFTPRAPQHSVRVTSVTDYSSSLVSRSTVHNIIGRPDPIVVIGEQATRAGSLQIWAGSYAAARAAADVFATEEPAQLRQRVEGLDMYFIASGVTIAPFNAAGEEQTRWRLDLTYVEIARPDGELTGALGWTFAGLAAAYPDFNAVLGAYPDFTALRLDERGV